MSLQKQASGPQQLMSQPGIQRIESRNYNGNVGANQEHYNQYFNQQRIDQENKYKINKICEWVIHRRNLGAFLLYLAVQLLEYVGDFKVFQPQSTLLYRVVFLLLKKHTMIVFRLYRRLKLNDPEKYNKFSEADFQIFMKSEERDLLLNFIKSDLNISKILFNEVIKFNKSLIFKKKDEFEPLQYEALQKMEEILNNKL